MAQKQNMPQNKAEPTPVQAGTFTITIALADAPDGLILSATKNNSNTKVKVGKKGQGFSDTVTFQTIATPTHRVFQIEGLVFDDVDLKTMHAKDALASGKLTITIKST